MLSTPAISSTGVDVLGYEPKAEGEKEIWSAGSSTKAATSTTPSLKLSPSVSRGSAIDDTHEDFKLPDTISLSLVILGNALLQMSFYIVVSSANAYADHLGGTPTFSGLVIGIPSLIAGLTLFPMVKFDQGRYKIPLTAGYGLLCLGNILYGLAYHANFLYLIFIGRFVSGLGFIALMYCKRYCSDPRIVGVRRRTTLAGFLVMGQGLGFTAGPFLGGVLYKIGFPNTVFNGLTSPGWLFAIIWAIYFVANGVFFKDIRPSPTHPHDISSPPTSHEPEVSISSPSTSFDDTEYRRPTSLRQWGVIALMMWYAMTCFLVLGAWESNIPVYTEAIFGYDPFRAGNFIALGGVATFPFLILNVFYARYLQDRVILACGVSLGLAGQFIMLALVNTNKVTFGSFYVCWFIVALGFNLASTCTLSLLSKLLPPSWNSVISLAIQNSNLTGRVAGAVLGGSGVKIGISNFLGLQIAVVGIGLVMQITLWRDLKAKTG
ncbi:hypothetical protein Hypma_002670 [Hypsizygus marmoreus]|uniref:Major facilitator superfamily (MFS) profile domain-containing protein n=1 Tax=Hypsizygus marmoreus TaxID=39966 RepID=A0A369J4N9_HYPMA|nr:hypothetical protein Hypma_002670 [Hypsizygus marmoreus]